MILILINAIGNVTGPSTGYLTSANDSVRDAGGEVYVSTQGIYQADIEIAVKNIDGNINIISGIHGDMWGGTIEHLEFFIKDVEKFGSMSNVKVFNYNNLSSEEILSLINSKDKTILGWCHSEYFSLMREGFK